MWNRALELIHEQVNTHSFDTWFRPTRQLSLDGEEITLEVPSRFTRDWLNDHYSGLIENALQHLVGQPIKVNWTIKSEPASGVPPSPKIRNRTVQESKPPVKRPSFINPRYNFGNFVVGASNQFAHAACLAAAELPGRAYNPLFIYGGVGLGKTHLLHAIGNFLLEREGGVRLYYTSCENFMNELISSIQRDRMVDFRNKYRNMEVLLVDDIQFIAGKDRTQEEFFHTFNSLHESRKQIVISSDHFPKEIPTLEERLRSRFEGGLIADIQAPDLETKVAILKNKAAEHDISLRPEVALLIASKVRSNIRELEGCLAKVNAYSRFTGQELTVELAQEVLSRMITDAERSITIENIQKATAEFFGIKPSDLRSSGRQRSLTLPRQVAMYLCKQLTSASFPDIGRRFGGKDHSTVIYSCKKVAKEIQENDSLTNAIKQIKKTLESL